MMALCKKLRPLASYCSAALGSMSRMALAALLFLWFMATAKGEIPLLSLAWRSRLDLDLRSRLISGWWSFSMARWRGVLPSAS